MPQTRSQYMSNADAPGAAAAASGSQQPPKPVQIAFVLYPGFTALDIIGPFEVLAFVPGHEAVFVAAQAGPISDDTGRCQLIASASFDQVTLPDVVVIGGTLFNEEPDRRVVQWLRQVHPATTWTTSVCTGSDLPGRRGNPRRARCHHSLGLGRRAGTSRRPLHRAAGGGTRNGDHRSGRLSWHRHGPHLARPDARPADRPRVSSWRSSTTHSRRSTPARRRKHQPNSWNSCAGG